MKNLSLRIVITSLILFISLQMNAQWGKYTLIAPQGGTTVKLVDLAGTTYKTWNLSGSNGYCCVLTSDRCIVRLVGGSGGDSGSRIEKVDWDGNVVWKYTIAAHHDICVLPNGNVLATVKTSATTSELSSLGFTGGTTTVSSSVSYDKIVEIDGVNQKIVWEWRFIDHLVQSVKSSASNYGTPANTPGRFNIQIKGDNGYSDWMHTNGVDYNPQRDQIVISCKYLKEVFVIDHSTTTAQAATSSGGLSGKGGDFLYRWGNPSNYGKTTGTSNTFGTIHNASWVLGETYRAQSTNPSGDYYHAYAGQISVFSNTNVAGMTIIPPYSENSFLYDYTSGSAYAPSSYSAKLSISGRSTNMGCAQPFPNGNMLIYPGSSSTVYEKNSSGTQIWSNSTVSNCAKVARYSEEYVRGDYAELCANVPIGVLSSSSGVSTVTSFNKLSVSAGKAGSPLSIINLEENPDNQIELYDLNGRKLASQKGTTTITLPECPKGIYIIRVNNQSMKLIIQ